MSVLEIFILSVTLSVDTFVASLSSALSLPRISRGVFLRIVAYFSLFQTGFLIVGWLLGGTVSLFVHAIDHWVAFILLSYIGGKMLFSSIFSSDNSIRTDIRDQKRLIAVSIATSIDALAVGISMALISLPVAKIAYALFFVMVVTAIASSVGLKFGRGASLTIGKRAELVAGFILIFIGIKILLEHIWLL